MADLKMHSLGRLTKNDRSHNTPVKLAPTKSVRMQNLCCATVDAQPRVPLTGTNAGQLRNCDAYAAGTAAHSLAWLPILAWNSGAAVYCICLPGTTALLDDSLPERRRVEAVWGGRQSPTLIMSGLELFFCGGRSQDLHCSDRVSSKRGNFWSEHSRGARGACAPGRVKVREHKTKGSGTRRQVQQNYKARRAACRQTIDDMDAVPRQMTSS